MSKSSDSKTDISITSNQNNIENNSQNNEILYEITGLLEKVVSTVTPQTKINDILSELKNIIANIYKIINENNRKTIKSKKSTTSILTIESNQSEGLDHKTEIYSEIYSNGNKYEGEIKNGKREGKGIMEYNDGHRYEGDWKNDLRDGKGVYCFKNNESNKDKYEGEFKNGKAEGKGISYYNNGDKYEGEYKNWNKEGKGI